MVAIKSHKPEQGTLDFILENTSDIGVVLGIDKNITLATSKVGKKYEKIIDKSSTVSNVTQADKCSNCGSSEPSIFFNNVCQYCGYGIEPTIEEVEAALDAKESEDEEGIIFINGIIKLLDEEDTEKLMSNIKRFDSITLNYIFANLDKKNTERLTQSIMNSNFNIEENLFTYLNRENLFKIFDIFNTKTIPIDRSYCNKQIDIKKSGKTFSQATFSDDGYLYFDEGYDIKNRTLDGNIIKQKKKIEELIDVKEKNKGKDNRDLIEAINILEFEVKLLEKHKGFLLDIIGMYYGVDKKLEGTLRRLLVYIYSKDKDIDSAGRDVLLKHLKSTQWEAINTRSKFSKLKLSNNINDFSEIEIAESLFKFTWSGKKIANNYSADEDSYPYLFEPVILSGINIKTGIPLSNVKISMINKRGNIINQIIFNIINHKLPSVIERLD